MSTLIKRGNVYHAAFKSEGGKIVTVTTKATTKEDARRFVKEAGIDELEAAGQLGSLTNEVVGRIKAGGKLTTAKAVEKYLAACVANTESAFTIDNKRVNLHAFLRQQRLDSVPPSAISADHIRAFINDESTPIKLGTRQVMLINVRGFLRFCAYQGWIHANPAGEIKVNRRALSHDQLETEQRKAFTKDEVDTILHVTSPVGVYANPFWHFAVQLGWETGARLEDIASAAWASFNEAGFFICRLRKTNSRIAVPISDKVDELLCEIPVSAKDKAHLFPEQHVIISDVRRRSALSQSFGRLCKRIDITDKSFHCLRHAFAERHRQHGATWEQIAESLGHVCTDTTKGYVTKAAGGKKG